MALAVLFNIPANEAQLGIFSFHNQDMHRRIIDAIQTTRSITLPLYPIDPILRARGPQKRDRDRIKREAQQDLAIWGVIHQALHADFTRVLGIAGLDFSVIDLERESEWSSWINLHANEHRLAADMLGLS